MSCTRLSAHLAKIHRTRKSESGFHRSGRCRPSPSLQDGWPQKGGKKQKGSPRHAASFRGFAFFRGLGFTNAVLEELGLLSLKSLWNELAALRRMPEAEPHPRWCGGPRSETAEATRLCEVHFVSRMNWANSPTFSENVDDRIMPSSVTTFLPAASLTSPASIHAPR